MSNIDSHKVSYKLRILVTSDCPAKCAGCHNEFQTNDGSKGSRFVDIKDVERLILGLHKLNRLPYEVVLSGGEPSLFNDLDKLAKIIKTSTNTYISLNSNCVGWNNIINTLEWLDEIKVHIEDVPYKDNPQAYMQTIGLSNHVLDNIKTLPNITKDYQLRCVNAIMRSQEQTQRVIEFCRDYGFNTKLIEESLVTTNTVSYSIASCLDYLYKEGYQDVTPLNSSSYVMKLRDVHTVFIRRCTSEYEPFVCMDKTGLVEIKYIGHKSINNMYTIDKFLESDVLFKEVCLSVT